MATEVHENMRTRQNTRYDKGAHERPFHPGDHVLVLLPTSSSKLIAQWQGLYDIIKRIGKVNYQHKMYDRRKKTAVFHVNMLQKWHTRKATGFLVRKVSDDIPFWNDGKDGTAKVGTQLSRSQVQELHSLLKKYESLFQTLPGHTTLTEHHIVTGQSPSVCLTPYRIPHGFRDELNREMLQHGVIEHSTSNWASPVVTVQEEDKSLRLYVDHRRLNSVSKGDAYPKPQVEDLIDRVGNATYIVHSTSLRDTGRSWWQQKTGRRQPLQLRTASFSLRKCCLDYKAPQPLFKE